MVAWIHGSIDVGSWMHDEWMDKKVDRWMEAGE